MYPCSCPADMTRRHFMKHLAGAAAMAAPAVAFTNTVMANAVDLKKKNKSCILLWMGGGPSTIDMFDMKPGAPTGGQFKPVSTKVDGLQITELMPELAKQMDQLAVVRSMSTREADHNRGRYYMHTGYVPNPTIEHPGYGSVVAHELAEKMPQLEIPPFVSVGGGSVGPGFLGMTWAPFVVDSNGDVRNLKAMGENPARLDERLTVLNSMEDDFMGENRGDSSEDHFKVLKKTVSLMTSKQMAAFKVQQETQAMRDKYGTTAFGKGCLMARRLVEAGVPFVEVDLGGWDNHQQVFTSLQRKLPELDKAWSALISDLKDRGLYDSTAVVWMGEFGRTPRINGNAGRDHFARAWSVVVGGAGFKRGTVIGQTNEDGMQVTSEPYDSKDLMASVLHSLGISLDTTFTSKSGRPMKIANSGKVIKELFV